MGRPAKSGYSIPQTLPGTNELLDSRPPMATYYWHDAGSSRTTGFIFSWGRLQSLGIPVVMIVSDCENAYDWVAVFPTIITTVSYVIFRAATHDPTLGMVMSPISRGQHSRVQSTVPIGRVYDTDVCWVICTDLREQASERGVCVCRDSFVMYCSLWEPNEIPLPAESAYRRPATRNPICKPLPPCGWSRRASSCI